MVQDFVLLGLSCVTHMSRETNEQLFSPLNPLGAVSPTQVPRGMNNLHHLYKMSHSERPGYSNESGMAITYR